MLKVKSMVGSFPVPKKIDKTCSVHKDTKLVQGTIPGHTEPFCPKCAKEAMEEKTKHAIKAFHDRKTKGRLYKDSVLTDRDVLECSFDNFNTSDSEESRRLLKQAMFMANQYLIKDFKGNTVLSGKQGTGKTHLAYSMLRYVNEHAEPQQSCLFIDFNELVTKIKNNFNNKSSIWQEGTMLDQIGNADLVVIDDLGSEASFKANTSESSEWNQRFLYNILNRRNRTIITTNLSGAEIEEVYNPKIASRINKGIGNHAIKFSAELTDKRKEAY